MSDETLKNLGPLRPLVGTWEGVAGDDLAPSDDRGTENNKFREVTSFTPLLPVQNHEQMLYGLRYATLAYRLGEKDPFHDEVGYWLWDPKAKQVMKGIVIPRGMTTLAGGSVEPDATRFKLTAELGSHTFGICSNPFLDKEFQTVGFELEMIFNSDGTFTYDQDTKIKIKGQKDIFHHRDKNTLKRMKA